MNAVATVLEADLEAFLRKRVRLLGGYTIKLAPTEAGVPDRLVMMPGGSMYLVELKTESGRVSPIQQVWHTRIRQLGGEVYVLHGKTQILEWLRWTVTTREAKSRKRSKALTGVR